MCSTTRPVITGDRCNARLCVPFRFCSLSWPEIAWKSSFTLVKMRSVQHFNLFKWTDKIFSWPQSYIFHTFFCKCIVWNVLWKFSVFVSGGNFLYIYYSGILWYLSLSLDCLFCDTSKFVLWTHIPISLINFQYCTIHCIKKH